ncbi:SGNH/GDSL hydrolase family protein [Allorhodopirellula heiligendammensis]|uniref:SGNH hydrolase-type esterase domain-containing protein n=1 Tax=Allorhodopirellula heiligendammensis TaxID=2714739 RepID=A0A5C6CAI8_9BACT|nr:SGNH/GDSL hydrolase family protein [Allorhodopirellula heiligendammensis]TWU19799.1 hypothetical protein Poly21_19770 [Allorhodopirellula heiligendammensis]
MRSICYTAALLSCWLSVSHVPAQAPIRPGDHVAIVGNTFADQLRIHGYLETMLVQHWPEDPVSIRNLGWGGDMLTARDRPTGFPSEEQTLTDHRTDVIIACFGMGESFGGESRLSDFRASVQAFIESHAGKQYNGQTDVRLVLISPIAYEQLGELTPHHQRRNHELAMYSRAMEEVARAQNVPFIDINEQTRYLMDEPQGPNLTTNGIHLNRYGYWATSHFIFRELIADDKEFSERPWRIFIDASDSSVSSSGVKVSHLSDFETGLTFRVAEVAAATLPPPTHDELPPQLAHLRDSLTVVNLPPGIYSLKVDDELVVTASHRQWAEGVAVDGSPAHKIAEAIRSEVNEKNLQFTYSWKTLNQVHIVGERKKSPSGKQLPAEVIEFNRLANERDARLRSGIQRTTREWSLTLDTSEQKTNEIKANQ